jgi:DNA repair exonuclease SbcCD ATPase subunit
MARQKNTIGPKVIVDGEAEFRKAIKDIENTMKTLNSEMKVVTSQFDKNDNSVEALTARNTVLNKQIEEQRKKLEELQKGLKSATESYGATDERTQKWQRELNNATAKLNEMERQLRVNTETINKNESATDNLGDEVENLGKGFKDAESKALTFGDVLKANIIGDVIVSGLRKVGGVLKESITDGIRLASDLAESQNVVDVTFGKNAKTIDDWSRTLDTAFGMSELSAKQYVGTMGAMLKSMQLTDDQVLTMSQSLVQLAGDMASFYNIDVETAFNKLRSGISGETEPLKQLGINLSVANLEAFALAEGIGKSYSKMTQAEQATLRYNYLIKVTADAQGDFARTSDSLANQQRILDLQLENLQITMGKKVVPALTDGLSKINAKIDESGEALAEVAGGALKAVTDGMLFVIDNAEPIISGIAGITAGLAAFKVGSWINAGLTAIIASWRAYKAATEGATVAQWAMNAAQSASPIGLLATGIGLLTAGLTAYAFTANDATEATSQLNKEVEESNQTIESNIKSREDNIKSIESEYGAAQKLADTLYDLADKTNKTSTEKVQMASLVEQLNKAIPDLNLNIDKETGALSKQREEVNKLIEANLTYYKVKAAQESLTTIASDIFTAENNLKLLEEERIEVQNRFNETVKKMFDGNIGSKDEAKKIADDYKNLKSQLENIDETIPKLKKNIEDANKQWDAANEYIKNNADVLKIDEKAVTDTSDAIKDASIVVKQTLNDITDTVKSELSTRKKALDDSYNKTIEKIRDEYGVYEEKEKSKTAVLQEQLSEKKSLIEQMLSLAKTAASQESEAFSESSKQILEAAQQLHNEKISMYMEEYLAQVGAIDESTAATIQAYKDEIAAIEKAQSDEDAALKEKQNKEKIQKLQDKIDKAKDDKERIEAVAELEEEISRQKREELAKQRQDKIKSLNEQIKDATEKANQEKSDLLKILNERVASEKQIIEDQTKHNIEKIQEERRAKEAAETAKYNAAKKTLDDTEKAVTDYLKRYKDILNEETSDNISAVAELAQILNGTGIFVYAGKNGVGISESGVSDGAPTRSSIQNERYRINHGLQDELLPMSAGVELSPSYQATIDAVSRAITESAKIITSSVSGTTSSAGASNTSGSTGTAVINSSDKADIVNSVVSKLKQFDVILDGDKVGKFAVNAVSREMTTQ